MKTLSKLVGLWALSLGLLAHANTAVTTVDLTVQLTKTQQRELVQILTQESAAVAERQAVGYLTKALSQDASAYWTARLSLGGITVQGLQAIHNKVHQSNLSREEVMRFISQDEKTPALVLAANLTGDGVKTDVGGGEQAVGSGIPKARSTEITDAQAAQLFRQWNPRAVRGTEGASAEHGVALEVIEAHKKNIIERAANRDPQAAQAMVNAGIVLRAVQDRGCSLNRPSDTNGCGILHAGAEAWIAQSEQQFNTRAAANFEANVLRTGLGHEQPVLVQQGNLNVLRKGLEQGASYWASQQELDQCYQGAVN